MTDTIQAHLNEGQRRGGIGVNDWGVGREFERITAGFSLQPMDALTRRIADLHSLRPGWFGPESVAPPREAVNTLFIAARSLGRGRGVIGASPHPDGYINIEWCIEGVWRTALLFKDHMHLTVDDEASDAVIESDEPLDAVALAEFLRFSE